MLTSQATRPLSCTTWESERREGGRKGGREGRVRYDVFKHYLGEEEFFAGVDFAGDAAFELYLLGI